jgi:PadR family transcriptional regulator, regulatory protein PadR
MSDVRLKNDLLVAWEDTYKKGQLTLWIFLALIDGDKYMNEIKSFIEEYSENSISCEDQSLYRALRKFEYVNMIESVPGKGNKGPDRKYYMMTTLGLEIFNEFTRRNIKLFYNKKLMELMNIKTEKL